MQIFRLSILPLSRSILIVICIVAFVNLWHDFLLPLLAVVMQRDMTVWQTVGSIKG